MSTSDTPRSDANTLARLTADVALAVKTIEACNKWITEAKPLLERGGIAERERDALRAENAKLRGALEACRVTGGNAVTRAALAAIGIKEASK